MITFSVKHLESTLPNEIKIFFLLLCLFSFCFIIGKYFIEGHVPLEAVNKLLIEQPNIDGIALPGMPIGTPGMPGDKDEPYVIYQLKDGKSSVFMTI